MQAMIVCPEPLAARAGAEVLRQGGNAVDAATAASYVQAVVDPPLCGIGGSGCMNIFDSSSGSSVVVHFMAPAGSKAVPDVFEEIYVGRRDSVGRYEVEGFVNQMGYRSICVPTFVRGVEYAHRRFGTMEWEELLEPAVDYAREGFEVYPYVHRFWVKDQTVSVVPEADPVTKMKLTEACARIYLKDGQPYGVGERLVQSDLARVLESIAHEGADVFYEGSIAGQIATDMEEHGGFVTYEDLRDYEPIVYETPTQGAYQGMTVTSDYPPTSGIQFITLLNILDDMDLSGLEWNSAQYIDLVGRVLHEGFEDRRRYYADPAFVDVPVDMLISEEHAQNLRQNVLDERPATSRVDGYEGTTHLSVVDAQGNAVSFTHSIGSGSGVVTEGLGFVYNNMMGPFNPLPGYHDSVAPGKRAVVGGGPLILLDDGRVRLVIGSPGGSRKTSGVTQVILNLFVENMPMQEAVTVPRFHTEEVGVIYLEPAFSHEVAEGLRRRGYDVEWTSYGARVQAVLVDDDGCLHAGADPRGGGGVGSVE
ncbi:MAG: gamma-glutamyltransferase [bacterium]